MAKTRAKKAARPKKKKPQKKAAASKATPKKKLKGAAKHPAAYLSDLGLDGFGQLARRLLQAEAWRLGMTVADLQTPSVDNRPDGGVDAFLRVQPAAAGVLIREGPSIFQFKLTFPGSTVIINEVTASTWMKDELGRGTNYVLTVGSVHSPGEERSRIVWELESGLSKVAGRAVSVVLLASEELRAALHAYPSTWQYVKGAEPALQDIRRFETWEERYQHEFSRFPWTADQARKDVLERLVAAIRAGEDRVLRVAGAPGAGKTRLVVEAIRLAGAAPVTGFLPRHVDAADRLGRSAQGASLGVLVVDECQADRHAAYELNWMSSTRTVITIGPDDENRAARARPRNTFWVEPLDVEARQELARRTVFPALAEDTKVALAAKSGGYPKLIQVLFEAVAHAGDGQLDLGHQEIVKMLRRFLAERTGTSDRAVLALALPSVYFHDDAPVMAAALGVEPQELNTAQVRLNELALTGLLQNGLYITPILLGDWLAASYWATNPCGILQTLIEKGAKAELLGRCLRRLRSSDSAEAREVLTRLLNECRPALDSNLGREGTDEAIRALANLDAAAGWSVARLRAGTALTQPLARALARCCWEPELFHGAALQLADGLAHAPVRSQIPRGWFADCFALHFGATRAGPEARLQVLRATVESSDAAVRLLAVDAARAAFMLDGGRSISNPMLELTDAWAPATRADAQAWLDAVAGQLMCLLVDPDAEIRDAAAQAAVRSLRQLIRAGYVSTAVTLVEQYVARGGDLPRLRQQSETIERFDLGRTPGARDAWQRVLPLLAPRNLVERVRYSVQTPEPDGVEDLARTLLATELTPAIWNELFDPGVASGLSLGEAVGQRDIRRSLLGEIVRRGAVASNRAFAVGYLLELRGEPSPDDVLDRLAATAETAELAFEATWRGAPSSRGLVRFERMLVAGTVPIERFQALYFGAWLSRVSEAEALVLIHKLRADPSTAFRLAFQLAEDRDVRDPLAAQMIAAWVDVPARDLRGQLQWEWSTAAARLAGLQPMTVARRCLQLIHEAEANGGTLDPDVVEALGQAAMHAPAEVWSAAADLLEQLPAEGRWGFARSLRNHLPATDELTEQLVAWIGTDEKRAELIALVAGDVSGEPRSLSAQLLARFGTNELVAARLADAFHSGSWAGPMSGLWQAKLAQLERLERSPVGAVASWAGALRPGIERRLAATRQAEDAYAQGAIDLPHVADRH